MLKILVGFQKTTFFEMFLTQIFSGCFEFSFYTHTRCCFFIRNQASGLVLESFFF